MRSDEFMVSLEWKLKALVTNLRDCKSLSLNTNKTKVLVFARCKDLFYFERKIISTSERSIKLGKFVKWRRTIKIGCVKAYGVGA